MKRPPQRRIEREIQLSDLFIDDRPDLPGPRIRRISRTHPTDLLRQADADGPFPRRRNSETRPDMGTHKLPTVRAVRAGEDIETGLIPFVKPARNLDRFV